MNRKAVARIIENTMRETYAKSSLLDSRSLCRNGPLMPILGLGGQAVFENGTEEQCEVVFSRAIKLGVRYIDTAMAYGPSQERFGRLMVGVPSDVPLFVATKSVKRTREEFFRELDLNFKALKRAPDLMHVHAVSKGEQRIILGRNGPLRAALEAKERGLCGFVGLTSHDDPDTFFEVLRWSEGVDVVMVAASAADTRFMDRVLPYCVQKGIGVVAMKVLGKTQLVRPDGPAIVSGAQALRYILSWNVSLAIVGFSFPEEVEEMASVAWHFEPMTKGEMRIVEDAVLPVSQDDWFYRGDVGGIDGQVDLRPALDWNRKWPWAR